MYRSTDAPPWESKRCPLWQHHLCRREKYRSGFCRFAKVVFDVDIAEAGVYALEDFIRECGLPTKMSQLKSTVEITPEVLRKADVIVLVTPVYFFTMNAHKKQSCGQESGSFCKKYQMLSI